MPAKWQQRNLNSIEDVDGFVAEHPNYLSHLLSVGCEDIRSVGTVEIRGRVSQILSAIPRLLIGTGVSAERDLMR